ncbi:MAG TPA: M28 family metallopeptidase [Thermoanaerobaculia bacterium]|nr:M28 family metallopeptidase [Thermoanaerobaculia bacterium]
MANEVSGETAKRTVEGLSRQHRMRGSRGFRNAADQVVAELKRYGLADAHIESLPADGKIFYGTQRSRPAWNAEFAELWELDAEGARVKRLASWDAAPIVLAQDSFSGEATAPLVDVGAGTRDEDYKDVKGKLVLTSSMPSAIAPLAIGRFGAAGIISYAQNQRTGWYGEDETLIRWGHLDTFAPENERTFAFMVSLQTARALQARLARGETIRMHAKVIAGQEPGEYDIATATIPGSDLRQQEIVFSCHLDHPRPGANDNASGCAAILEAARMLSKLIREERLPPPRRTLRFVWPPEIEGTLALLNGRPELAHRIKAAIHLDMVGGGPETKAIFHVTRGPASQPSFVYDVAQSVGMLVNDETARYAMTGSTRWPLLASDGTKDPLRAAFVPLTLGSDHQVYSDSSWGIPAIYLNDWPDRYIHTNKDVPANIDSTKLGRAAFIAAATGYALAIISNDDTPALHEMLDAFALERRATALRNKTLKFADWYETEMKASLARFIDNTPRTSNQPPPTNAYRRNPAIKGTMGAFGYDYFTAHYAKAKEIRLGEEYRYEALNLVDGRRTVKEIRDLLAAIYGDVPLPDVEQYLAALASIDVVQSLR